MVLTLKLKVCKNKSCINLIIFSFPAILSITDTLLLELHDPAVMSCLAAVASPDSPNTTITWWRADPGGSVSQVTSMGGTSINTMSVGTDQLMSTLTIEMVDASHNGTYTCNLTTNIGSFNASVLLQITGQSN